MRNRIIFFSGGARVVAGLLAAHIFGIQRKPQPPVFQTGEQPIPDGDFCNGIIESDQVSGSNINVYPEVSGRVTEVLVKEGQQVLAGTPLLKIDDSVQRRTTAQLHSQAEAALTLLKELKHSRARRRWTSPGRRCCWPKPMSRRRAINMRRIGPPMMRTRMPSAGTCWTWRRTGCSRPPPLRMSRRASTISPGRAHGATTSTTSSRLMRR